MDRLPLKLTIAAAAFIVIAGPHPAGANPSSSNGSVVAQNFEYTPYNGHNNTGQPDQGPPPDNYTAPPAAGGAVAPNPPGYSDRQAGDVYRRGGRHEPDPDADDNDDRAGSSPPSAYSPPQGGYSPSEDVYSPARGASDAPPPAPPPAYPPRGVGGPPEREIEDGPGRVEVQVAAPDDGLPPSVVEHDARRAAIEGWRSKVADRYGPEFSQWRLAAGKHVDCHPDRRDGLVCTASAQPVRGFDRNSQGPRDGRY